MNPKSDRADLPELLRQATQADWRTRALAVSALGRFAREDGTWRWLVGFVVRRIPGWRHRFPLAGSRGRYLQSRIADGLSDRSWPVRVAAALTLGECRASSRITHLRRFLRAPLRAERIAAAAAIVYCGGRVEVTGTALLADTRPAPASIGDRTRSIDFLTMLAARHQEVLAAWTQVPGDERPGGSTPTDWASFLAGPVPAETYTGTDAEIQRYAGDAETEYLLTKPFSHINRTQNVRLLHSFLVAAEHLRVAPGGKVLDLGGGSGWVSELLAQFGYRPFTLDLSSALLGVGHRRFANAGLVPRFMVGDMTRLPVATGSMDAVLVMDALHHVPDVPAVFREAFRVLTEGGQFVLAEPGEGHAETEKARAEMAEHGVEEREIHLFEMIEYGRDAGFDQIRAVPHYVPGIAMSPAQIRAAASAPADEWMMYQDDRVGHFPDYIIQSMFARPVMVFRKGSRPVDSQMPRLLKAEITAALTRASSRVSGTVSVRNVGDTIWLGADNRVGYVQLGLRLLDADQHPIDLEFGRVMLAGNVAPGKKLDLSIDMTLPDSVAPYVLKIDMVDEGICWFEDAGSVPVYVRV